MTRWYTEKKHEFYYQQAKKDGYRARSSYKLKEIQRRYHPIKPGDAVLDLGAAPGGWSQIAQALTGEHGTIISVDLNPMKPLPGVVFIHGDITHPETHEHLTTQLQGKPVDVILSDMSPNISGNYTMDQARSMWLCQQALQIAHQFLRPQGNFVCKIFEGEDTPEFITELQDYFNHVHQLSPKSSRKSSSEIYIIAKSFKNK